MILSLCVSLVMAAFVVRRDGFRCVQGVWCVVGALNNLLFFMSVELADVLSFPIGNWHFDHDFSPNSVGAMWIIIAYMIPAVIFSNGADELTYFRNGFSDHAVKLQQINLVPLYFFSFLTILFLIYHVFTVDWTKLIFNTNFEETREPGALGFNGAFEGLIHNFMKYLGIFCGFLLPFAVVRKDPFLLLVSLISFVYSFFLMVGATSKWSVISLVVLFGFTYFIYRSKVVLSIGVVLFVVFYFSVISIRAGGVYGVAPFFDQLLSLRWIDFEVFITVCVTFFSGTFVVAEALSNLPVDYPLSYKVLSFSPLISSIDGFSQYLSYEHRAAFFKPYNAISEAVSFGSGYALFFWLFLCVLFYFVSKVENERVGFLIFVGLNLGVFMANLYPLRQSFRVLFVVLVVTAVCRYFEKRSIRRLEAIS